MGCRGLEGEEGWEFREVVFLGRSLSKYMQAARNIGKAGFAKNVKIYTYRSGSLDIATACSMKVGREEFEYPVACRGCLHSL